MDVLESKLEAAEGGAPARAGRGRPRGDGDRTPAGRLKRDRVRVPAAGPPVPRTAPGPLREEGPTRTEFAMFNLLLINMTNLGEQALVASVPGYKVDQEGHDWRIKSGLALGEKHGKRLAKYSVEFSFIASWLAPLALAHPALRKTMRFIPPGWMKGNGTAPAEAPPAAVETPGVT